MPTLSENLWPVVEPNASSDNKINPPSGSLLTYVTWNPFFFMLLFGIPISNGIEQLIPDPATRHQFQTHLLQISLAGLCGIAGLVILDAGTRRKSKALFWIGITFLLLALFGLTCILIAFIQF